MKQMSTSVSDLYETDLDIRNIEKAKKNEMDVDIRFGLLWNGSRHPFCWKNKKNMKQMLTFVSGYYETDLDIRFAEKTKKRNETDVDILFKF